jgi:hypothetical protein
MEAKFVKNKKYYTGVVYEWNLPTGSTCPFALDCKVTVNRQTGKFDVYRGAYKCYAASPERFPGVREHRWKNFEYAKAGKKIEIPKGCTSIRIHSAGDFFNQKYFDMWIEIANENPDVEFWAYTKSLNYWAQRLNEIPKNLELTASYGGNHDELISLHDLKYVVVFQNANDVPDGMPIDNNDDCARNKSIKAFALLDNFKNKKKG